ncbi:MAG: hypothetical protein HQM09_24600 [Candidatus Riflebacteria bacterium]|nr:hypothetical protein [Candidatus Riflebacteria bacterium]
MSSRSPVISSAMAIALRDLWSAIEAKFDIKLKNFRQKWPLLTRKSIHWRKHSWLYAARRAGALAGGIYENSYFRSDSGRGRYKQFQEMQQLRPADFVI